MGKALGIHWIVTTHGTWLHGDPRGSWRNGKLIGPDLFIEQAVREQMRDGAIVLSDEERGIVAGVFGDAVVDNDWLIYAVTIQATHAHVVFGALREPIERVIAMMKYRSAKRVMADRRARGIEVGRSLWGEGRYCVYVDDVQQMRNTIAYVEQHDQGDGKGKGYDWVKRF